MTASRVILPYEFEAYEAIAAEVRAVLLSFSDTVEVVSVDEAYILLFSNSVERVVDRLRTAVFQATGCSASAGIGRNRLLAKMATRKAKPNGQYLVDDDHVAAIMDPLEVSDIPGIGWASSKKVKELGVTTVAQLKRLSVEELQRTFGAVLGLTFYERARGIDHTEVKGTPDQRKSIGAQVPG